MKEVIFIKSLCQDIVLFFYKTVNFKTTTESLGKNSRKIPLCTYLLKQYRLITSQPIVYMTFEQMNGTSSIVSSKSIALLDHKTRHFADNNPILVGPKLLCQYTIAQQQLYRTNRGNSQLSNVYSGSLNIVLHVCPKKFFPLFEITLFETILGLMLVKIHTIYCEKLHYFILGPKS